MLQKIFTTKEVIFCRIWPEELVIVKKAGHKELLCEILKQNSSFCPCTLGCFGVEYTLVASKCSLSGSIKTLMI